MTSPLYNASIPVLQQMLRAMSDVLKKAEEHATQKNIDPNALLQARLFPDMFPLVRQVQIAADFSKGIASRLAGAEVPSWPDTEVSFADLQALIAKALAHIGSFKPEQFDSSESREIVLRPGTPKEKKLTASAYLLHYGLPQFFFHVTTTYAILRHNGVEVATRASVAARFRVTVDGGSICLDLLGASSTLTKCLLPCAVNYTVDPLRAFDVGLMMAAMQRERSIAGRLIQCTSATNLRAPSPVVRVGQQSTQSSRSVHNHKAVV
ncbi:conserved hypothetical protein [Ricinus communis]|uniref:DUF1993 domain-containing protein n=1 Tax=Ricinus communis TaxID=3988 RepID=B9TE43_RICCO|nr:conserved hypothetical protein [Ricinus communis]